MIKRNITLILLSMLLIACVAQVTPIPTTTATVATAEVTITQDLSSPTPWPTNTLLPEMQATITQLPPKEGTYLWHEKIIATVFWVGEKASAENDFIDNKYSAWVTDWIASFGGVDTPDERNPNNRYHPLVFTPKENPFYVALPAGEYDESGPIPNAREQSPWFGEAVAEDGSLFKNRWVQVIAQSADGTEVVCFGQWEDTGPGDEGQYAYVFGTAPVRNDFGLGAGIDLSPAMAICLNDTGNISDWSGTVSWSFIDDESVPFGPWRETVTTSGPNW